MSAESDERWPIAKDIATAIGVGLVLAFGLLYLQLGFVGSWVACSAGVFFLITLYHVFGPAGELGVIVWLVSAGAVGGAAWWLVADSRMGIWEAAALGAALIAVRLAIEVGLPKLFGWKE